MDNINDDNMKAFKFFRAAAEIAPHESLRTPITQIGDAIMQQCASPTSHVHVSRVLTSPVASLPRVTGMSWSRSPS